MESRKEKDWLIKLVTSRVNYAKTRARLGKEVVTTAELIHQYQLDHPEQFAKGGRCEATH